MQSESIANIVTALTAAALEMTNVEKNMNVGSGQNTYKGVADKDVKLVTRTMLKHGLLVTPLSYKPTVRFDTWEEEDSYKKGVIKRKKEVFVEIEATYRVVHTSGEFIDIVGYGQGVDTQDKAAGKATTYSLKYALIYLYNLVIGDVDDTDMFHSNDIPTPTTTKAPVKYEPAVAKSEPKVTNSEPTVTVSEPKVVEPTVAIPATAPVKKAAIKTPSKPAEKFPELPKEMEDEEPAVWEDTGEVDINSFTDRKALLEWFNGEFRNLAKTPDAQKEFRVKNTPLVQKRLQELV